MIFVFFVFFSLFFKHFPHRFRIMPSFNSFILMSKQGKVRLAAYFKDNITDREKARDVRFIQNKVLDSSSRYSNIIEKGNEKLVFRRYASLFFIASVPLDMNELIVLEEIHLFVEVLDHYFGNVCELDIIFKWVSEASEPGDEKKR